MTKEELQQRVDYLETENKQLLRYMGALRAHFGDAAVNAVIANVSTPESRIDGEAWRGMARHGEASSIDL